MNLDHLTSKLRLDINHLQWQRRTHKLSQEQFRRRFNTLANGYCSLVSGSDREQVQSLVSQYRANLLN